MVSPSLAYMHNNVTRALFLASPLYKAKKLPKIMFKQTFAKTNNMPEKSLQTIFIHHRQQETEKWINVVAQVVRFVNKMSFKSIERS